MQSRISRIGTSLGIIIPRHITKEGGFQKGLPVEISLENDKITISKIPEVRKGWSEAFAAYAKNGEDELAIPDYLDSEAIDLV
ncbi:MAG: AbrB/MazE/SpoVT family DNA-binding domain-containing protein [Muribaculaceae bacterium]|nr:AbrB/MazE/SpoVT family DNA-binding domain-containing protein [Muribaculaceae bacterium]